MPFNNQGIDKHSNDNLCRWRDPAAMSPIPLYVPVDIAEPAVVRIIFLSHGRGHLTVHFSTNSVTTSQSGGSYQLQVMLSGGRRLAHLMATADHVVNPPPGQSLNPVPESRRPHSDAWRLINPELQAVVLHQVTPSQMGAGAM